MVGLEVLIQDAEGADGLTPLVTEERIGDAVAVGERPKIGRPVVADGEQRVARPFELGERSLQLDQLRLAVRSPDRAAVQDDDRATPTAPGVQIDDRAALVGQPHVGERIADLRHAVAIVELGHR